MQRGGIENGKISPSKFPAVCFLYLPPRIQYLSVFCSFNNPSLSATQINLHVTSVIRSNPVKLTVVTVNCTELTDFLKRETLAGTVK